MSGVYIPMKLPETCLECPLETDYGTCGFYSLFVEAGHDAMLYSRRDDCPLVPVPEHGRLIDADAFIKQKTEQICENCNRRRGMIDGKLTKRFVYAIGDAPCRACDTGDMLDYVDDAPTIIPASGGTDNE